MIDTKTLKFSAIAAMTVAQDVADLVEVLARDMNGIEAQLDFPTDDQTDEWERRAVTALGHKRALHGCALRRLHQLTRGAGNAARIDDRQLAAAIHAEAKARDRQSRAENRKADAIQLQMAQAERLAREAAHRASQVGAQDMVLKRQTVKAARAFYADSIWRTVAYELVDRETCDRITARMLERVAERLDALTEEKAA